MPSPRRIIGFLVLLLVIGVGIVLLTAASGDDSSKPKAKGSTTSTTPKKPKGLPEDQLCTITKEVFKNLKEQGSNAQFTEDQLKCGQKNVNFATNPEERGSAAFVHQTLKSHADVAGYLHETSPQAVATQWRVAGYLGKYPGEYARAQSGEGYVPLQFTVAVKYFGTTFFQGGAAVVENGARATGANDIVWLFFTQDGILVPGASIRADCGNSNFTAIMPLGGGSVPPITIPPPPGKCDHEVYNEILQQVFCGSPTDGPEQQPVQDNPGLVLHTPGYPGRGNLEQVDQSQQPIQGADPYKNTNKGTLTDGGGTAQPPSGISQNPDGTTDTGSTGGFAPGTGDTTPGTGTTSGPGTDPGGFS